ncbi:MAG: BolA/IbaG family iron-sulfur metabolism protein [Candidatus Accumulibacter sp.]|jgi:acid stress-induced BolA-like protein IbaG/YrbA|nr:BolA/IbaG family iron-sulfur metabolism protein [Accumulibacter sp.]
MIECEDIKRMISGAFFCEEVIVESDGRHYEAVIVSPAFEGRNRVARQQMINAVLKPYFDSGELHALSMKTLTSSELEALRG